MSGILNVATMAAIAAGKIILQSFDRLDRVKIQKKANGDFVSSVDLAAESEIIQCIKKYYPGHNIISEESGAINGVDESEFTWIIDPLDGTNNFIHGVPHFAVAIAIKEQEQIICSVIYDPIRDEMFTAQLNKGAFLNNRKIKLADNSKNLATSLVATGFPRLKSEHLPLQLKAIEQVTNNTCGIRRMGSTSLDLAYVASGRWGGYWDVNMSLWDLSAGQLIALESGAIISDFFGKNSIVLAPSNSIVMLSKILQDIFKPVDL